jgi:hypothetical protein
MKSNKHIKSFNEHQENLEFFEKTLSRIKIKYKGDPKSLYLIIYTGYDDFLSHNIYYKVDTKKEGIKLYKKEEKKSAIVNGYNIYNYKEVFDMYKNIDNILKKFNNISEWVKRENNMLNKFGFEVEEI